MKETQYRDAKMLSIQFCDKQCFSCHSCHNNESNMSDRRQESDIKSAHVGHHVFKGGVLAEFLKIMGANG